MSSFGTNIEGVKVEDYEVPGEQFEMYKEDADGLFVTEDGHVFNQAIMDEIEEALQKILDEQ